MRILFLDIDGVLNNENYIKTVWQGFRLEDYTPYIMPEKVKLLNKVFHLIPDLQFIVHSNWGRMMPEAKIKHALNNNGFAHWDRFIDLTPKKMSSTKSNEIKWALDEFPECKQYLVIDDDHIDMNFIQMFDKSEPKKLFKWVQTGWEVGLTPQQVRKILLFFGYDENEPVEEV